MTALLAQRSNEPWLSDSEFAALLPATLLDEDQAWRGLAPLWLPTTPAGEVCAAAGSLGVHCFKRRGTLALLRQLDRPVLLPLYGADGVAHFAHLVGLAGAGVRLKMAGQVVRITPQTLATLWRGEFGTLWRAPPGYTAAHPQPDADWLAVQLAHWSGAKLPQNKRDSNQANKSLNGSTGSSPSGPPGGSPNGQSTPPLSPALRTQLSKFQRAERLDVTGQANAMTLMRLNRISGISEPRLPR